MPIDRRRQLLEAARTDDFVIFEDDHESELNFSARPLPALKSLDSEDRVIYIGSLSKTISHGLRIGYLVGPSELIRELRALRRLVMMAPGDGYTTGSNGTPMRRASSLPRSNPTPFDSSGVAPRMMDAGAPR